MHLFLWTGEALDTSKSDNDTGVLVLATTLISSSSSKLKIIIIFRNRANKLIEIIWKLKINIIV